MKLTKLKIINSIQKGVAPSTELFKSYLQDTEITYLILPLLNLLTEIPIKAESITVLYNLIKEVYINYKNALIDLGYLEEVSDNILILYLVLLSKNYNFQINEISFLLEAYNELKDYNPNTQYSKYIFYSIKIYILYLYTLNISKYRSLIPTLIAEIDALYKNLEKPFIF